MLTVNGQSGDAQNGSFNFYQFGFEAIITMAGYNTPGQGQIAVQPGAGRN